MNSTRISLECDPSTRMALASLLNFLVDTGYDSEPRHQIIAYAAAHGTLEGCLWLDPEDEPLATEAFVVGFPPESQCSHAWGSPLGDESRHNPLDDVWTPNDVIAVIPPELEEEEPIPGIDYADAPDCGWSRHRPLAPICGGAPDEPPPAEAPFEPSPQDWREYEAWSEVLDCRHDAAAGIIPADVAEFLARGGYHLG